MRHCAAILLFILGVSILTVFCDKILCVDWPELFPGGGKVLEILDNTSQSFIAGFVFYLLTIRLPELRKRSIFQSYVTDHIAEIVYCGNLLLRTLRQNAEGPGAVAVSLDRVRETHLSTYLSQIDIHASVQTWIGDEKLPIGSDLPSFMKDLVLKSQSSAMAIVGCEAALPPDLTEQALEINGCKYFKLMGIFHLDNADIVHFSEVPEFVTAMLDYFHAVKKLMELAGKHFGVSSVELLARI